MGSTHSAVPGAGLTVVRAVGTAAAMKIAAVDQAAPGSAGTGRVAAAAGRVAAAAGRAVAAAGRAVVAAGRAVARLRAVAVAHPTAARKFEFCQKATAG